MEKKTGRYDNFDKDFFEEKLGPRGKVEGDDKKQGTIDAGKKAGALMLSMFQEPATVKP